MSKEHSVRSEVSIADVSTHPWEGYLTGPENELALAAAQAMAQGERDGISPLVVYGPSGVGKSRLMAGLVAEWLRRQPSSSVAHLDGQSFVTACFEAAAEAGEAQWSTLRTRFRSVALFVLEDIEQLERAPLARAELAHTLDALDAKGAFVALSARSAPRMWLRHTWPSRLVNRLIGGLVVRIDSPSLTSRRRYILQHASQQGIKIQAEAVERLAQCADGYRTLDGWLTRLALEVRLKQDEPRKQQRRGKPLLDQRPSADSRPASLDFQMITSILAEETVLAKPIVTIDTIAQNVAKQFGVRLSLLRGSCRRTSVVVIRHVAMHLARKLTGSSFAVIGTYFGGRDPATVRYACKTILVRLSADLTLAAAVANFEASGSWIQSNARHDASQS